MKTPLHIYLLIAITLVLYTSYTPRLLASSERIHPIRKDYIDTVLVLRNLKPSTAKQMLPLTIAIIKSKLYKHYKDQGCFIENNYPSPLTDSDYNKNSVMYDTVYFTDLNGDTFADAIVTYWLTPPGATGHCYQPHKAMEVSGAKGYMFINPEFIDSLFTIESVNSIGNKTFIKGCNFDCGGSEKCKRNLRLVITHTN